MEEIRKVEQAGEEEDAEDASVASSAKPKELSKTELLEKAEALGLKIAKSKSKAQIMEEIRKAEADADDTSVNSEAEAEAEQDAASPVNGTTMVNNSDESDSEEEEEEEDPIAMYKAMKTQDITEMCTQHGLSSKGNRDTLIKRLIVNNIK
jgi:hypothetical protein